MKNQFWIHKWINDKSKYLNSANRNNQTLKNSYYFLSFEYFVFNLTGNTKEYVKKITKIG